MRELRCLAVAAALAATGCVSQLIETNPPKPRYTVGAVNSDLLQGPSVDWSLIVEDPRAARAYDTTKLAVSPSSGRIEYFGGGEWAARAPRVFQTALIESFEDSGRILHVGDRLALPIGEYVLQTDIRRIDLDVSGGSPTARLNVYARLTNGRSRIYAAQAFAGGSTASSSSGDDVAAAFDSAFKDVIANIVTWSFEQGDAAEAEDEAASS
jgi:cholesterol transport system auxiliary component